jgi:SAM-dependent methyltransferase
VSCKICESDSGIIHTAAEKMLGLGDQFHYFECGACGALSLMDPPSDWAPYYPADYYSFSASENSLKQRIVDWFRVRNFPVLSSAVKRWRPFETLHSLSPLKKNDRVLDVGCGAGEVVQRLRLQGILAEGIDPFITEDVVRGGVTVVRKAYLAEIVGQYDVILLSHSLEHMPNQLETLRLIRERLTRTGRAVIRIPIVNKAWQMYHENWTQLDAPRHLFIHTPSSLSKLAEQAGMSVVGTVYDSNELQFFSLGYQQGLTLNQCVAACSSAQRRVFRREARKLNKQGLGDTASFILVPG